MIKDGRQFDTNVFFSGGAGIFLQYHDVVRPINLYAVIKMIITNTTYGLPLSLISNMSIYPLMEWYLKRRFINPLRCLDPAKKLDSDDVNKVLSLVLENDPSIYKLAPILNVSLMMQACRERNINFPVFIYNETYDAHIERDAKTIFPGIQTRFIYGDIREAVTKCSQNFTYILSDIELLEKLASILEGTCSHILLTREYRYNYNDHCRTFKYSLYDIAKAHPYVRIGTTVAFDVKRVALSYYNTIQGGI